MNLSIHNIVLKQAECKWWAIMDANNLECSRWRHNGNRASCSMCLGIYARSQNQPPMYACERKRGQDLYHITISDANLATSEHCSCLQKLPCVVQLAACMPCCCQQSCLCLCSVRHLSVSFAACCKAWLSLSVSTPVVQAMQLVAEIALGCAVNTPPTLLLC